MSITVKRNQSTLTASIITVSSKYFCLLFLYPRYWCHDVMMSFRLKVLLVIDWHKLYETSEKKMYYNLGSIVVIAVCVSIIILWFIGCFLWSCLCCECCCDFKNKIYRNPIAARPSIISVHRRGIFFGRPKPRKCLDQSFPTNNIPTSIPCQINP